MKKINVDVEIIEATGQSKADFKTNTIQVVFDHEYRKEFLNINDSLLRCFSKTVFNNVVKGGLIAELIIIEKIKEVAKDIKEDDTLQFKMSLLYQIESFLFHEVVSKNNIDCYVENHQEVIEYLEKNTIKYEVKRWGMTELTIKIKEHL